MPLPPKTAKELSDEKGVATPDPGRGRAASTGPVPNTTRGRGANQESAREASQRSEEAAQAAAEEEQRRIDAEEAAKSAGLEKELDAITDQAGDGVDGLDPELLAAQEAEAAAAAAAAGEYKAPSVTMSESVTQRDPFADELMKQAWENETASKIRETGIRAQENQLKSGLFAGYADLIAEGDANAQEVLHRLFDEQEQRIKGMQEIISDSRRRVVDPAGFFNSQGESAGFNASMATAVGHLASVLGGGHNAALDTINRAIDRNIRAQERNIAQGNLADAQQMALIQRFEGLTDNRIAAHKLAQVALLQQARFQVESLTAAGNAAVAPEMMQQLIAGLDQKQAGLLQDIAKESAVKLNTTADGALKALRTQNRARAEIQRRQLQEIAARHGMTVAPQQATQPQGKQQSALSRSLGNTQRGRAAQDAAQGAAPEARAETPKPREVMEFQAALAEQGPESKEAKKAAMGLYKAAQRELRDAIQAQPAGKPFTLAEAKVYIDNHPVLKEAGVKAHHIIRRPAKDYRTIGGRTVVVTHEGRQESDKDVVGVRGKKSWEDEMDDINNAMDLSKRAPDLYRKMQKSGYGTVEEVVNKAIAGDAEAARVFADLNIYFMKAEDEFRRDNGLGVINSVGELKRMKEGSGVPTTLDQWLEFLKTPEGRTYNQTFLAHATERSRRINRMMNNAGVKFIDDLIPDAETILKNATTNAVSGQ